MIGRLAIMFVLARFDCERIQKWKRPIEKERIPLFSFSLLTRKERKNASLFGHGKGKKNNPT